ncbi:MAG: hypothetical protein B7Z02_06600 [Rhodobacterales bacterium 32-67-9]|nr:MAG: hypothetical protein B7Z02_06600 [Rhodobacterales bacterium 32-67-9]
MMRRLALLWKTVLLAALVASHLMAGATAVTATVVAATDPGCGATAPMAAAEKAPDCHTAPAHCAMGDPACGDEGCRGLPAALIGPDAPARTIPASAGRPRVFAHAHLHPLLRGDELLRTPNP